MARAEAYLHAKFHLYPSNRLTTVHERHRQTDRQTGHTGQTDNGLIAYGEPFYTRSPKNDGQLNRSDTKKFDDLNAVNQRLGQLEKANVEHDR